MSRWWWGLVTVSAMTLGPARDAHACGGTFVQVSAGQQTISVDGTRMAVLVSASATVLWSQIHYTGSASEFAWVFPVRPGARLELSHDEWFAALDAVSAPVIDGPTQDCGGGGGGCGCGCGAGAAGGSTAATQGSVQVLVNQTFGPYDSVVLQATGAGSLSAWLSQNGYAVPAASQTAIDAYVAEGYDFVALRLRPGQGTEAIRPVRITTASPTPFVPLRMMAGAPGNVAVTLFVLAQSDYRTDLTVLGSSLDSSLKWDGAKGQSNYEDLAQAVMSDGSWLLEYAGSPGITGPSGLPSYTSASSSTLPENPNLDDVYFSTCDRGTAPPYSVPPPTYGLDGGPLDAIPPFADGSVSDAEPPADAGLEASGPDPTFGPGGACSDPSSGLVSCCQFDDLAVADEFLSSFVVTRLRANLPPATLAQADLSLTADPSLGKISNRHEAHTLTDPSFDLCQTPTKSTGGGASGMRESPSPARWAPFATVALAFSAVLRKRRR